MLLPRSSERRINQNENQTRGPSGQMDRLWRCPRQFIIIIIISVKIEMIYQTEGGFQFSGSLCAWWRAAGVKQSANDPTVTFPFMPVCRRTEFRILIIRFCNQNYCNTETDFNKLYTYERSVCVWPKETWTVYKKPQNYLYSGSSAAKQMLRN